MIEADIQDSRKRAAAYPGSASMNPHLDAIAYAERDLADMPENCLRRARAAIEAMPPAMEITDWFARNADRKNPDAFINTNPEYFAQECASAIDAALGEG